MHTLLRQTRVYCCYVGEEIVAALAEGSATFQGKTQFAQAKYKKKKQKKYTVNVTVQRPTARSLCEVSKCNVLNIIAN